jgi:hypothetical protein
MAVKVIARNMSDEQRKKREAILRSLEETTENIQSKLKQPLSAAERAIYEHGLQVLKRMRGTFKAEEFRHDGALVAFFQTDAGKQQIQSEGVGMLSRFFERPLSTIKRSCQRAGEPLPYPLEALHNKYNSLRDGTPEPAKNDFALFSMFSAVPAKKTASGNA